MASEKKFIKENIQRFLLKEYLQEESSRAGFGGVDVQRTPMGTRVTLVTERPGIVIGRKGATIKAITKEVEEKFNFDNPQIEVQEAENPNLNAQIVAEKLAFSLERGWHFRRAGHSTVRRVMRSGARGCQIVLSGKLTGQRHRTEKFKDGYIKFCGEPRNEFIDTGFAVAKLKPGVSGVKVEIMRADSKLPDEVNVISRTEAAEKMPDIFDKEKEEETIDAVKDPAEEEGSEEKSTLEAVEESSEESEEKSEEGSEEASNVEDPDVEDIEDEVEDIEDVEGSPEEQEPEGEDDDAEAVESEETQSEEETPTVEEDEEEVVE